MTTTAAELLRSLRARTGRTQVEVARAAGIPATVLSAYERGRREPSFAAVAHLIEVLGYRLECVARLDPTEQGRKLVEVLELAEALPYEPRELAHARW